MNTIKIQIKPLSVNKAWQGQRFKTKAYKIYEKEVLHLLPALQLPPAPYKICFEFGFSNKKSDLDNPVKILLDILQKKYGFDDKEIFEMNIKKHIVSKKHEYFSLEIKNLSFA